MSPAGARPRLRFAPSPTGSLHLGNARTALFNWLVARRSGGSFVLRLEDTDVDRAEAGSEQGILDDLRWLGLGWDEGPDVGGPCGPYRQSERLALYRAEASRLVEQGRAYRCFCTEAELESERRLRIEQGLPQRYSGRCRRLEPADSARRASSGEPFALRFAVADTAGDGRVTFEDGLHGRVEVGLAEVGDPVILRSDGSPTYNFAVVVDDAAMGISLVVRGDDHLSNTPRQLLLYEALGHAAPRFVHLPLVRGPDGRRLSKRHGAVSVAEYRRRGYPPEGLLNALVLLGWSPRGEQAVLTRDEMVAEFSIDRINVAAASFDSAKLDWLASQHIRRMPGAELAREVRRCLVEAGKLPASPAPDADWLGDLAELLRPSLERWEQVEERAAGLFHAGGEPAEAALGDFLRGAEPRSVVRALADSVAADDPLDREAWQRIVQSVSLETGLTGGRLLRPIRVVLTGRSSGLELDRLVPLAARGHRLFPGAIPSLGERARRTLEGLG